MCRRVSPPSLQKRSRHGDRSELGRPLHRRAALDREVNSRTALQKYVPTLDGHVNQQQLREHAREIDARGRTLSRVRTTSSFELTIAATSGVQCSDFKLHTKSTSAPTSARRTTACELSGCALQHNTRAVPRRVFVLIDGIVPLMRAMILRSMVGS
jgi:hypothetical protein